MSVPSRVVHKRRETITALPLYHSGRLLKKSRKEKDFKNYYAELRGATLFLYNDDTQDTYTEKLDLDLLSAVELNSSRQQPIIFNLDLPPEEVQLKMDSVDSGEVWRGYILTVVNKEIPPNLQLLPGQRLKLDEVLNLESKRNPRLSRPPLPPRPNNLKPKNAEIPACFFNVTRQDAEKMLEENPENGSIILRPSAMPKNYALTLRQKTSSGPVLKNYRVTSTNSGFVIELENPITVPSLSDVLKYFLEKTEYRLCPYVSSQPYDTRIVAPTAPKCVSISSPAPIATPKAQVAPMLRSQTNQKLRLPPEKPDEGEYVLPDDEHTPDDNPIKSAELDNELREVLKFRRENMYHSAEETRDSTYENNIRGRSRGTAHWNS